MDDKKTPRNKSLFQGATLGERENYDSLFILHADVD